MTYPPFGGLWHVTGESDVGKTSFALSCGVPLGEMAFLDHDIKGREVVKALIKANKGVNPFGVYIDMVELRSNYPKEIDFVDAVLDKIKVIEGKKMLVWDNFSPFEDMIYPWAFPQKDKWRQTWASMGAVKGAQQWDVSFQMTEMMLDEWLNRFEIVCLITHLKEHNLNGVKTGKMVPAVKRVIPRKSNFRVWLRVNERGGGVPIGLILKRVTKPTLTEEGVYGVVNVLPRKMAVCDWEHIREYWEHPFGEQQPTRDQVPNEHELSILNEALTPDQRRAYELALKYGVRGEDDLDVAVQEAAATAAVNDELRTRIRELGKLPPGKIVNTLKDEGHEVSVEFVLETLGKG